MGTINEQAFREYAHWLELDKKTRSNLGLASSRTKFAAAKGVTTRTLRRWEYEDTEFQVLREKTRKKLEKQGMSGAVVDQMRTTVAEPEAAPITVDLDGISGDERQLALIKGTLAQMAARGDQRATEVWMKYFGKALVDAEAADEADLAGLTDDELVDEVCRIVGPEALATWLADSAAA